MAAIVFKEFKGRIPKTPPELLPEGHAANAENCDFAKTVLGSIRSGLPVLTVAGQSVIKGIYTENGSTFYTWPTEVVAYRSPVIDDSQKRIYYIDSGTLYSTVSPTSDTGGAPATQTKVGVPAPLAAPVLRLIDRTTLPDYPEASLAVTYWWTDGTTKYGSGTATVSGFTSATFASTKPTVPNVQTQPTLTLVVSAVLSSGGDDSRQLFNLQLTSGSTSTARSSALPGGVEMSLASVEDNHTVTFLWGVTDSRAYVYTYVNTWNEESAPSAARIISPTYLHDVGIATLKGAPRLDNNGYRPYQATRVYRTYSGADYLRTTVSADPNAAEYSQSNPNLDYNVDTSHDASGVGPALPSLNYQLPPSAMQGLVAMPNGWFAAFYDNKLYMSEPYRPHTWQYSMTFSRPISGICVGPQALVVATTDTAYMVNGPHPASVTSQQLPVPVGGILQHGMCKTESGVAFLSNDGIVLVEGSQASLNVSQNYWTREGWLVEHGATLNALMLEYADGMLICQAGTYGGNNTPDGFILRADEAAGALTDAQNVMGCLVRQPWLDAVYYTVGNGVYRWRAGYPAPCAWISRDIVLPRYSRFGVGYARVAGGSGTIKLTFYVDGKRMTYLRDASGRPASAMKSGVTEVNYPEITITVSNGTLVDIDGNPSPYFRLPTSLMAGALRWQVRIDITTTQGATPAGTNAVELRELVIASTMDEVKNV